MGTGIPEREEIHRMSDQEYKVLENRMRRAADRQGLRLEKSRARDPRALDYGTYQLVDQRNNSVVMKDWELPRGFGLNLHDVGRYLYRKVNIHVDYAPEHEAMTFEDTNGEPILSYRSIGTTGLLDESGRPLPDGWVLNFLTPNDGRVDEWVVSIRELEAVDEAVADAKEYLRRYA